jgi:hypothetical protein
MSSPEIADAAMVGMVEYLDDERTVDQPNQSVK